MSANSFQFGNSIFKGFLTETEELIAPLSHLDKFSILADVSFPFNHESAEDLSRKCALSMRKKASILTKAFPNKFKHTESLNLVANMCFFSSWKSFTDYCESFPNLPDSQRRSSGDSLKLLACLWRLSTGHSDVYASRFIASSGVVFYKTTGIDLDAAGDAVRKIFTEDRVDVKGEFLEESEILHLISTLHENPVQYYLMYSLSQAPLRNGVKVAWPDLENIDVGKLLSKTVLLKTSSESMPSMVREVIIACIMGGIHDYALHKLHFAHPTFNFVKLDADKRRLISALARPETRQEVSRAVDTLFSGFHSTSVHEALTYSESYSGFINDFYYDNFNKSNFDFGELLNQDSSSISGHKIKVFRSETFEPDSNVGARFLSVRAVAQDSRGSVSGYMSLMIIVNPTGKIDQLGIVADEIEDRDCIEMSLSLALDLGFESKQTVKNIAYITGWEVARKYRGLGIGKALLASAFDQGLAGLADLDFILARLDPMEYPVPPLEDSDDKLVTNYYLAKTRLLTIWDRATANGTSFGETKAKFHATNYMDICHGHPNLMMMAMASFQFAK
jgi:hypothetical protein